MVDISTYINLLEALNPVFGLMVNVFTQVLSVRYVTSLSLLKSIVFGFLFGFAVIFVIQGGL